MYHLILNGYNLNARTEKQVESVKAIFAKVGAELTVHTTERKRHAVEIARELTQGGEYVNLIAMGGDGTLHEVLNGIVYPEKCTLGLIPLGSGNDFAEALKIPKDPVEAAKNVVFLAPTGIDYIELSNGLRSINAVGMGMDVDVLQRTYGSTKTGKGKYFAAFIQSLLHYKNNRYRVEYDGKTEEHDGFLVCLGNGKQIGGGIKLFPDADVKDGYIDLLAVDYLNKFRTAIAFLKLVTGNVNKVKEVTHVRCKSVRVTPLGDTSTAIQAEGEIYENVALEAKIIEGKLKFYLPNYD